MQTEFGVNPRFNLLNEAGDLFPSLFLGVIMKLLIFFTLLFVGFNAYAVDPSYKLKHAAQVIESVFGDKVRIKPKSLLKFGRSEQVSNTTYTTLQNLPSGTLNETYISTNLINRISSSSGSDTEQMVIEGFVCLANGDKIFKVQSVTLAGQTETALGVALCRATRAYNNGTNDLVGSIYIYQDDTVTAGVPDTDSLVHMIVPAGSNQSFKASTTISSKDYWLITEAAASINTKTGSPIAELEIQVRLNGKVFRTQAISTVATTGSTFVSAKFDPVIIVPKNADVRMRALGSTNGIDVSGWMNGYLAKVID